MKYHVTRAGLVDECRAFKKECPIKSDTGENPPHFNTKEEAFLYVEQQAQEKYGMNYTIDRDSIFDDTDNMSMTDEEMNAYEDDMLAQEQEEYDPVQAFMNDELFTGKPLIAQQEEEPPTLPEPQNHTPQPSKTLKINKPLPTQNTPKQKNNKINNPITTNPTQPVQQHPRLTPQQEQQIRQETRNSYYQAPKKLKQSTWNTKKRFEQEAPTLHPVQREEAFYILIENTMCTEKTINLVDKEIHTYNLDRLEPSLNKLAQHSNNQELLLSISFLTHDEKIRPEKRARISTILKKRQDIPQHIKNNLAF